MRVGTDILEISRIKLAVEKSPKFVQAVLAQAESEIFQTLTADRQIEFLAGRFAAKEAYGKALGVGVGTYIKMKDISIIPDAYGAPFVAKGPIVEGVTLSISHSQAYATATAICDLDDDAIQHALQAWRMTHTVI